MTLPLLARLFVYVNAEYVGEQYYSECVYLKMCNWEYAAGDHGLCTRLRTRVWSVYTCTWECLCVCECPRVCAQVSGNGRQCQGRRSYVLALRCLGSLATGATARRAGGRKRLGWRPGWEQRGWDQHACACSQE